MRYRMFTHSILLIDIDLDPVTCSLYRRIIILFSVQGLEIQFIIDSRESNLSDRGIVIRTG